MIDVFKRVETKYLLSAEEALLIQEELRKHSIVPDAYGRTTIQSLYYDTPENLLVLRSLQKPMYKEKLRLRSYGLAKENSPVFLEIKKKYDGIVYKRRITCKEDDAKRFIVFQKNFDSSQIGRELNAFRNSYKTLIPKMLLIYERVAWLDSSSDLRITFDENIRYRSDNLNLSSSLEGKEILQKGQVLMEIKTGFAYPLWLCRLLNDNHIYKTSFSKYGTAYQDVTHPSNMKGENIICPNYLNQFSMKAA